MGLSTTINGVPVKAARRPSGYFFKLQDVLAAAGVPEDMARKVTGMYRDSGGAAKPCFSRLWFVSAGDLMDYISRVREGLPGDAATDGDRDGACAVDRLEECVAACGRWAASRGISGWEASGAGPEDADWGVVVNGILVRAARSMDGTYFFEPSGMLRAAGIPDDGTGEPAEAGRSSGHAAEHRLPGASGPVCLVDLEGWRDFAARRREAARSGLEAAIRRDGAKAALDGLDEAEDALCRLEECITECGRWAAFREGRPEPGGEAVDGASKSGSRPAGWGSPGINPYDRPGLVPEDAAGMADTLLDRLPVLCRTFGISQCMDRERQLARIVWLLAFHDGPVEGPDEATAEASFLWRGKDRCRIGELVRSAMTD